MSFLSHIYCFMCLYLLIPWSQAYIQLIILYAIMFSLLSSIFYSFFYSKLVRTTLEKSIMASYSSDEPDLGRVQHFMFVFCSRSEPFRLGNQLLSAGGVYFRLTKLVTPLEIYFEFWIISKLKPPPSFSISISTFPCIDLQIYFEFDWFASICLWIFIFLVHWVFW